MDGPETIDAGSFTGDLLSRLRPGGDVRSSAAGVRPRRGSTVAPRTPVSICLAAALLGFSGGLAPDQGRVVDSSESPPWPVETGSPALVRPEPPRVEGVVMFRADVGRTGRLPGPAPRNPRLLWRFPREPMCAQSAVGTEEKIWCGTGWTGQPVAWRRVDGVQEVIFGAFDRAVHFVSLHEGRRTRPDLFTGDIIKGSPTLDPQGEPLLYIGSRDNQLRIIALDRPKPRTLWSLDATWLRSIWNNDWDGNPLVAGDLMFVGGENGFLYSFRLNRDYDRNGLIQVRPERLLAWPGWNSSLLAEVGDRNASIESSVALYGERLYFTNSAGRLVGLDVSRIQEGLVRQVFEFRMGDDVDATPVVDEEGMLYVAAEMERLLPRAEGVGQLVKLNPYRPDDPVLWSLPVPPGPQDWRGGIWSSPALGEHALYATTQSGLLLVVERNLGELLDVEQIGPHAWSSPVLVQDRLLVATCGGEIISFGVAPEGGLDEQWRFVLPGRPCIESTPLVYDGVIVVGARDGFVYALADRR